MMQQTFGLPSVFNDVPRTEVRVYLKHELFELELIVR